MRKGHGLGSNLLTEVGSGLCCISMENRQTCKHMSYFVLWVVYCQKLVSSLKEGGPIWDSLLPSPQTIG
jgi:hypothetical protein